MIELYFPRHMTNVLESGFEFMDANNPNGSPKIKGYNIINGKLQSASNGETFESRNPALFTDCLGEFPLSTKDDVHQALNAARDAFPSWSATCLLYTSPSPRDGLLSRMPSSA